MLKKFGMVGIGVTAAVLAAAPMASASQSHHEDHHRDHDRGHHQSHKGGDVYGGNTKCAAKSGDVAENESKGLLAGVGPILDGNAGQILSCNSFLNNNFSGNDVELASPLLNL